MGELWGVISEDFQENWSCYNGVRQYFDHPIYWPWGQYIAWYFDPGSIYRDNILSTPTPLPIFWLPPNSTWNRFVGYVQWLDMVHCYIYITGFLTLIKSHLYTEASPCMTISAQWPYVMDHIAHASCIISGQENFLNHEPLGLLLLIWINFNPNADKIIFPHKGSIQCTCHD